MLGCTKYKQGSDAAAHSVVQDSTYGLIKHKSQWEPTLGQHVQPKGVKEGCAKAGHLNLIQQHQ